VLLHKGGFCFVNVSREFLKVAFSATGTNTAPIPIKQYYHTKIMCLVVTRCLINYSIQIWIQYSHNTVRKIVTSSVVLVLESNCTLV